MATMRDSFTDVTTSLMDEVPTLAVVLAEIGTAGFARAARRHPARVVNVGIREQLMIGVAAGLAVTGFRTIAHSYAPFVVERPFEQVKLDLGHQDLGGILVSVGASYDWAAGGRTHQAPEDVALIDTLPGWEVLVPGHPNEVGVLLRAAVAGDGRVYLRLSEQANRTAVDVTPGHATIVRRGAGPTVVAVGPMLDRVLAATEGRDVTVLYATTVRPFDGGLLRAVLDRPEVILVEPMLAGTSARVVSEAIADVPHRLLALGVPRVEHRRYGSAEEHDAAHGLDVTGLRGRIDAWLADRAA